MKKLLSVFTVVIMIFFSFSLFACNPAGGEEKPVDRANSASVDFDGGDKPIRTNYTVELVGGTDKTWSESVVDGETVLTFSALTADSVYKLRGTLAGSIVIEADDFKIELELSNFTVASEKNCPISVLSGDKATLTAKKDTVNFVYDRRGNVSAVAEQKGSAIYSEIDLTFGGQGSLTVVSDDNGGVHTKDDLEAKKLSLNIKSSDCAFKGNDSVTIVSGALTLVSTRGDGIKTSGSDISSKGKQRGSVEILGGKVDVYSAGDGIDAAYNVSVSGVAALNVYTDKYSAYSEVVTAVYDGYYLIRSTSNSYNYSIMYYNSESDVVWKNAEYYVYTVSVGGSGKVKTHYYYKVDRAPEYDRFKVYAYNASQQQGQSENFVAKSDGKAQNENYDSIAVSVVGKNLSTSWTNFTTTTYSGEGVGSMNAVVEGETDKGDYSTKGIKAENEIIVSGGSIVVTAYDDGLHSDGGSALESGAESLGNVTVTSGTVTVYSNDDGIHADGRLAISGGIVSVLKSYEGAEGDSIVVSGGSFTVVASDDGLNGSAEDGAAITVSGGKTYVCSGGDGIDSNSKTSFGGISFEGGLTVVISTSANNSCIDSESGYSHSGGHVLGICPALNAGEAANAQSISGSVTTDSDLSLPQNGYLVIAGIVSVKIPVAIENAFAVYVGQSANVSIAQAVSPLGAEDSNGVCWKV